MQKQQSFVNDQLNTAFVDGELNKTVSGGVQSNGWYLLDDPVLREEDCPPSNILQLSQKQIKNSHYGKQLPIAESSIKFKTQSTSQTVTSNAQYIQKEVDDDEDILNLLDKIDSHGKNCEQ